MDFPLVLSLDIGTSSTRAMLWDLEGKEFPGIQAQIHYTMRTTPDGGVEIEAADFVEYVARTLDLVISQAGEAAGRIAAVGVSTYWHSLIGLDSHYSPVTPLYSWADTRARGAAKELRRRWSESAVHARTGCMIHASYYPAKLTWIRETQADRFAEAAHWVSPAEFLNRWLFGDRAGGVSISMASATGLFNQETSEWDAETLQNLAVDRSLLSPIEMDNRPVSGLLSKHAARWPALANTPFYPAVGDGACGNIGSGCCGPARMAINLGTSGAIRVVSPHHHMLSSALVPPGLWQYRVDARRNIVGAAFSDGGNVFAWLQSNLALPPLDVVEAEVGERMPGAHGLTILPCMAGERSMGWNPDARGTLTGLHLSTTALDIVTAWMEAIALRFAVAASALRGRFPDTSEIIASGGALPQSPAWAQMVADAVGTPITLAAEPEASSRGAALLAAEAAGLLPDVETVPARTGRVFEPDASRHTEYLALLARQDSLYNQVMGNQAIAQ